MEQLVMFDIHPKQKAYRKAPTVGVSGVELGQRVGVLGRQGTIVYIGVGRINYADDHWHDNHSRDEYHRLAGLDLVPKKSQGVIVRFDGAVQPDWAWKTLRSHNV